MSGESKRPVCNPKRFKIAKINGKAPGFPLPAIFSQGATVTTPIADRRF
jgi:hypothetical protein